MKTEWWRWDGWPAAEEWAAFWGGLGAVATVLAAVAAGAAVWIAIYQLRAVIQSNEELVAANEETARTNLAVYRPYVVIEFENLKSEPSHPGTGTLEATLTIRVANLGRSSARNVRLKASPEIKTSGKMYTTAEANEAHRERVHRHFSGEITFPTLAPSRSHSFAIDDYRSAFADKTMPRRYVVTASYETIDGAHSWEEENVLDLDLLSETLIDSNWGKRISLDLQALRKAISAR